VVAARSTAYAPCVIAESFGAIFQQQLHPQRHPARGAACRSRGGAAGGSRSKPAQPITVDLQRQVVLSANGQAFRFEIAPAQREMLLEGLDPVALTLRLDPQITAFQTRDRAQRPWIYLAPAAAAPKTA
jgi:3-isopropylmalate/(R)-2-methylmalate dehydratase small subunit